MSYYQLLLTTTYYHPLSTISTNRRLMKQTASATPSGKDPRGGKTICLAVGSSSQEKALQPGWESIHVEAPPRAEIRTPLSFMWGIEMR